ncbi:blue-light-activated protein [Variibacter gotjawalensis]|uniref:histidine kinase n=1 Tax=Variibacter gotjawalensis TaxID=1333996 RepID=A0A0S3PV89_9BRAD|nr:PAS domain-containing protein [Variibacter gotjawalensis]NIK50054.1 two-component system cell cycle sensor histidine kinase/response regulator CckA [Variibacter gotjawalensis]RZS46053.1 two-component system cell cycle sensor histidine kinase/response regulator CckA [Variibacter gotjawalensis]BAT59728.1 blue-light-activated protein [Variibacter gotjawalensis]
MAIQNVSEGFPRDNAGGPGGSVTMVLAVAALLVAAAIGLLFVGRENSETYILMMLAALAVIGVVSMFAVAAGILRAGASVKGHLRNAVSDGAIDGILVTDAKGRVQYANKSYLALTGARGEDDVRPVERAFVGEPDLSEALYRLMKAAREGRPLQEEVRLPGAGGARWLRLRVRPLGESGPEAQSTVWTVADITRDRERQENVFQELQHAIDYLDHAPAGFFSVDAQGRVTYLNATLASWLDHDLAQIGSSGLALAEVVAGDGAALITTFSAAPGEVRTDVFDLDLRTRGGRTLPVRLYHKVAFGADGRAGDSRTLVLNRARDDGDPQRAAEVRFMRFFHNAPMAIATVDRGGRIVRSNAPFARLNQGVLKAETLPAEGRSILPVIAERDRAALEAAIGKAADGMGDIAAFDVALSGEGNRSALVFVAPVEGDERDGEAAIVYTTETTAQRALETQFAQSQKMQAVGQLAGGIAHDFNNVLSAIMMATDFLLNAHKPTDPSFQDIMQIKQNANRAAALVRQLLAFSRRQTLRPQVIDLGEVVSDLTMLLRRLIGEKVSLDVTHGRDVWPIRADISQFEQVIVNLAVNARDAMPDGGKLHVRTQNISAEECAKLSYKPLPAADYVLIEVADSGTGMPADILDKIFEPFFSTKEVGKGTGLGLSTVYGIIKQTDGFIFVDSVEGKGTTFRIFLPRFTGSVEEVAEAAVPVPSRAAEKQIDLTGSGTILLVEDEEGLRGLNARGLASRGYTVLEAGNGVEAIQVLEERGGEVDIVVSDVVMPEMDGPTLLKEMRQRNPNLKMIFVSGYAEDAFEKNLPEGGQFAFLPKPFTLKQLVGIVKETLDEKPN